MGNINAKELTPLKWSKERYAYTNTILGLKNKRKLLIIDDNEINKQMKIVRRSKRQHRKITKTEKIIA